MIIKRISIENFGKIRNKTMEFSPGMNILYGENESGKTTAHTFVKSMLYGIQRQRGRAARKDAYTLYLPWDNPAVYGGTLWFESGGKNFRIRRNFYKENQSEEFLCEDDRELLDIEAGDLEAVLGGVSETVYENTVSVAQLKSSTGTELVREVQNYMASYQGAGDSSVDLGRTMQRLKMERKGYQVQADRLRRENEQEKEKIASNMEYIRRELEGLKEQDAGIREKENALHPGADSSRLTEERIMSVRRKRSLWTVVSFLAWPAAAAGAAALWLAAGVSALFCLLPLFAGLMVFLAGMHMRKKLTTEIRKRERQQVRRQEKLDKIRWSREHIRETEKEKTTALANLSAEYQEAEDNACLPLAEELEIESLNLAMSTITSLSGNIHRQVGGSLRKRTSQILSEITGGKYADVLMDSELHMTVNTEGRVIPLEQLSRGTVEQIYFSLRMAAGELLCGGEKFPVILDEVFGMYDEDRLAAVLEWLSKEKRQVIICSCRRREMEIMEKHGIPYQKVMM